MREGWTFQRLAEVASFVNDGDWIESRHQADDGIRLIQTGNIGNGFFKAKEDKPHFISEQTFNELGCTEIFPGDCLVSRLPEPVGRACLIPDIGSRMITAVDCTIIRFKDVMLPEFFVYYSRSKQYERSIGNSTTGTTRKRISRKNLESILVPTPQSHEQERIVAELDLLQSIIDKQKAQLKEIDTLAQSIFFDMFGDPVENEKGWETKKLGDITRIGSSKRVFINEVVEQGIPFLRGTEIRALSDGGDLSAKLFITEEHYRLLKEETGVPSIGDLLLASICFDGQIWLVNTSQPFYYKDGRVLWIHFDNPSVLSGQYTRFFLREKFIREYDKVASGTTFSELKIVALKTINLPVPPLALQQSFAAKIEEIERQKTLITQSIAETQKLFDYTMDKYFG